MSSKRNSFAAAASPLLEFDERAAQSALRVVGSLTVLHGRARRYRPTPTISGRSGSPSRNVTTTSSSMRGNTTRRRPASSPSAAPPGSSTNSCSSFLPRRSQWNCPTFDAPVLVDVDLGPAARAHDHRRLHAVDLRPLGHQLRPVRPSAARRQNSTRCRSRTVLLIVQLAQSSAASSTDTYRSSSPVAHAHHHCTSRMNVPGRKSSSVKVTPARQGGWRSSPLPETWWSWSSVERTPARVPLSTAGIIVLAELVVDLQVRLDSDGLLLGCQAGEQTALLEVPVAQRRTFPGGPPRDVELSHRSPMPPGAPISPAIATAPWLISSSTCASSSAKRSRCLLSSCSKAVEDPLFLEQTADESQAVSRYCTQ